MGQEVNLLANYPRTKRNVAERGQTKTEEDRKIARQFDKDFFDGDRRHGYGGFSYHPRFWQPVVPDFQKHYDLKSGSRVLDIGCAKGFMLHDFLQIIPGIKVAGIDVSRYAIEQALPGVKPSLILADARKLPFEDHSFDLVIAINTIHNLDGNDLKCALIEMMRVSKQHAFLTVDAYRNDEEKDAMFAWNLTAKTILHVDGWKKLFEEVGYRGDYYWFVP
ncbi:MAG: Methyltransferase type 11 [Parachlamydiales bacterium]|nr:Methyltransferase type 11 [Parachlamydiales bacterium]